MKPTLNNKQSKPEFTLLLVRPNNGHDSSKKFYPVKVGVTFPTDKGNQRIQWDIIPAECELRDNIFLLVPYEQGIA